MLSFKELLQIAKHNLKDLSPLQNPDFRLEQAEYKKDEQVWDVVVSFLVEILTKRSPL